MTDKPKTMTWAELASRIAKLTPEQQALPVVVLDWREGEFSAAYKLFLASEEDAGNPIHGGSPGEVAEGQPILEIY